MRLELRLGSLNDRGHGAGARHLGGLRQWPRGLGHGEPRSALPLSGPRRLRGDHGEGLRGLPGLRPGEVAWL